MSRPLTDQDVERIAEIIDAWETERRSSWEGEMYTAPSCGEFIANNLRANYPGAQEFMRLLGVT